MKMFKIWRCEFTVDGWGVYITPLIGYSWSNKKKSVWIGWLWFLWELDILFPKKEAAR